MRYHRVRTCVEACIPLFVPGIDARQAEVATTSLHVERSELLFCGQCRGHDQLLPR